MAGAEGFLAHRVGRGMCSICGPPPPHRALGRVSGQTARPVAEVQQNGRALEYADGSLRRDRDVVLAAVRQHSDAHACADSLGWGEGGCWWRPGREAVGRRAARGSEARLPGGRQGVRGQRGHGEEATFGGPGVWGPGASPLRRAMCMLRFAGHARRLRRREHY